MTLVTRTLESVQESLRQKTTYFFLGNEHLVITCTEIYFQNSVTPGCKQPGKPGKIDCFEKKKIIIRENLKISKSQGKHQKGIAYQGIFSCKVESV